MSASPDPAPSASAVKPGQLRCAPSGTTYKVLSLHGGYCEIADAVAGLIVWAAPNVWVSDMQFSSSIENVQGWPIAMCVDEHDEPVRATTMLHHEDDKTVWVPVCAECAEHAV